MGNGAGVRHYYIEAFTPYGYISLLAEMLKEVRHTYYLKGEPGTGKSTMIKLVGIQLIDRGYDVDYIRSVKEPDSVAGLLLSKQSICVLDINEFLPQPLHKGHYEREIDFNSLCRKSKLELHTKRIEEIKTVIEDIEGRIVKCLQEIYLVKEDIPEELKVDETKKIQNLFSLKSFIGFEEKMEDQPDLNEITEILSRIKKNRLSFYFLHSLQLDGWLNLAPRFIKEYDRICLEGEDSAKILRDILEEVRCLGQVMEIIIHPLKPYTIIGIVFPEKNLAVWKGNPSKIEEQGFIRQHDSNLIHVLEEYKKAKIQLKSLINESISFRGLDNLRSELISSILNDLRENEER